MKTLNEHLKTGQFKNVYLIYGPESYLRRQYRDRLKAAVLGDGDPMNYNYFEGKGLDIHEVIGLCDTLPFFADKRVVVVEDANLFSSSQEELTAYIPNVPETTCLIFVEESPDKRGKLFKTVSKVGYAADMASPNEKTLKLWIGKILKKSGRVITERSAEHFLDTVDLNMENLHQELEKLICYTEGRDEITDADIDAICTVHTENRIFAMIEAVAAKQTRKAMQLYRDLLTLKEPPLKILTLITRQFNQLLQIKELALKGYSPALISERTHIRDFIVEKNMRLTRQFTYEELREALDMCAQMDEAAKTGQITDLLAVEMVIAKYGS